MKKHGKASVSVMLALAAVLLVSLGYLSSQGVQEGFKKDRRDANTKDKNVTK